MHNEDLKILVFGSGFLILLIVSGIGWVLPVQISTCQTPPYKIPNQCHLYTWSNFPRDNTNVPITGLFSNDTSYYFERNQTNIVAFSICFNFISFLGDGNMTLFLQYTPDGVTWNNVDSGTGGSVSFINYATGPNCSLTLGHFPIGGLTCQSGNQICEFRIGGSEPSNSGTINGQNIVLSLLSIQFYYSVTNNLVICSPTLRSTTSMTITCSRTFSQGLGSQAITIVSRATNATGSGCGTTGQNCWRGPTTSTCTMLSNSATCTVLVSFSPAFVGTPTGIINYGPVSLLSSGPAPSFSVELLT